MSPPTAEQITRALDGVHDPEIRRPITELGMVKGIDIAADGAVRVQVWLTVAGCPLRETIIRDVTAAVGKLPGVSSVRVDLDVMSDEQRRALQTQLRGGRPEPQIPFAQPASLTRVYAVASGKGGVGKSSVTVNLAAALAASGHKVGVVDADIYGHSVPRMLGVTGRPTPVENMIMPPSAHDVKVISIGMFTEGNTPTRARGPSAVAGLRGPGRGVTWSRRRAGGRPVPGPGASPGGPCGRGRGAAVGGGSGDGGDGEPQARGGERVLCAPGTQRRRGGRPAGRVESGRAGLRDGVPIEVVSTLLGHSSVVVTSSVYGHLTAEDARAALEKAGWLTGKEVSW